MDDISSVFIDSSMFKAVIDDKDDFHEQAVDIWTKFQIKNFNLYTTNFILDETLTLLRAKTSLDAALLFKNKYVMQSRVLKIIRVSISDENDALALFEKPWRKLSFTDCTSFAVMTRLGITHAATFDTHFAKAGFTVI